MSVLDTIRRPEGAPDNSEYSVKGCEFQGLWPGIHEVLSRQYHKGKARETGSLMIMTSPGKATLRLVDRHSGQVGWYASDTVYDALQGLEFALQNGKVDWRPEKAGRK